MLTIPMGDDACCTSPRQSCGTALRQRFPPPGRRIEAELPPRRRRRAGRLKLHRFSRRDQATHYDRQAMHPRPLPLSPDRQSRQINLPEPGDLRAARHPATWLLLPGLSREFPSQLARPARRRRRSALGACHCGLSRRTSACTFHRWCDLPANRVASRAGTWLIF